MYSTKYQQIGYHGKTIAEYLNLSNSETGHCFRRTSATVLVDAGGNITVLKRHGSWLSTTVAKGYADASVQNKVEISNTIMYTTQEKEVVNINLPTISVETATR